MMRRSVLFALAAFFLIGIAACAQPAAAPEETVKEVVVTREVEVPKEVKVTVEVTKEVVVTEVVEVEKAAEPQADLEALKAYLVQHGKEMEESTKSLLEAAEAYYEKIQHIQEEHPDEDPYEHYWNEHSDEVIPLLQGAKQAWILAHNDYELVEGIVAGVPSLAMYDTWIDAGPPCAEAPDECHPWTLELPDGRTLEGPGNIFHILLETTLWGTVEEHAGLKVDLDGDGAVELGEAMPEANMFLASAKALHEATQEMNAAIEAWEPTLEDAFIALLTMIPTMGDYFEEWKASAFITGESPLFVAQTRLVDIKGIATSLDVIYDHVGPVVEAKDPALDEQIQTGFADLLKFLDEVHTQEQVGVTFTPEEADALGTEAQDKAQALVALAAQAAQKLGLNIQM
jgi:hypothetical protein